MTGSDVSADALAVARANGERAGARRRLRRGRPLVPLDGDFDIVAVEPALRLRRRRATLAPEVARTSRRWRCSAAPTASTSCAGSSPAAAAARCSSLEIGAGQAAAVGALLRGGGHAGTRAPADLAGIERVVVGGMSAVLTRRGRRGASQRCIAAGGVAVFPADTVYGLACDPRRRRRGGAALRAQGPAGGQAGGDHVLRRRSARCPARPAHGAALRARCCPAR